MNTPAFHTAIEHARQAAGLSYHGWAERAFSTPSYLLRVCRGEARPERDMVIRLCLALDLTAEQTNTYLHLAGHPFLDPRTRRDALISAAMEHRLALGVIDDLLRAGGWPGLLEKTRKKNSSGENQD